MTENKFLNENLQTDLLFFDSPPKTNLTLNNDNSNSLINSDSLKRQFKDKYKYLVSFLGGINILLIMMSRDCALMFFQLEMYLQNEKNSQILSQVYCICNCFFPILVGYITDYIGYHMGVIALYIPMLLGSLITLFSVMWHQFSLEAAVVGRILFAVGGESVQVIIFTIVVNYFRKSKAMGHGIIVTLSTIYLGYGIFKAVLFTLMFKIPQPGEGVSTPMVGPAILSLVLNVISFLLVTLFVIFENYWTKFIKKEKPLETFKQKSFINQRKLYPFSFWQSLKIVLTFPILNTCVINAFIGGSFSAIVSYNRYFFQLNMEASGFNFIGQNFFSSVIYLIMSFTCFFCIGKFLDKHKNYINFMLMMGSLLSTLSYMLFANFYVNFLGSSTVVFFVYYLASTILGVALAIFTAAIFTSIPSLVHKQNITICLGLLFSSVNFTLLGLVSLAPNSAAAQTFLTGRTPFWIFCCVSLILCVMLEFHERKNKKKVVVKEKAQNITVFQEF